jgi:hypothetical protein
MPCRGDREGRGMKRIGVEGRIRFGGSGDDYVVGVVVGKLRMERLALTLLPDLRGDEERMRLFRMGQADAGLMEWNDLGKELWRARVRAPKKFDEAVTRSVGEKALEQILVAIRVRREYRRKERAAFFAILEQLGCELERERVVGSPRRSKESRE